MGQCTFRSITQDCFTPGAQVGILGGYKLNRILSVEAGVTTGAQTQTSLNCDPFWLATDGTRTIAPIIDQQGSYYADIDARTKWTKISLQLNFNALGLLLRWAGGWSLGISPQISCVTTRTTHYTDAYDQSFDRQWHFGYGGQAFMGYSFDGGFSVQIYGGSTFLTGDRFDNIPFYYHTDNLIWESGLKLAYLF